MALALALVWLLVFPAAYPFGLAVQRRALSVEPADGYRVDLVAGAVLYLVVAAVFFAFAAFGH